MFRITVFSILFIFTFAEINFGKTKNKEAKQNHQPQANGGGTRCSFSDYSFFNGYCYSLKTRKNDGIYAHEDCNTEGGDLVSIHSDAENEFIRSLGIPADGIWIGIWNYSIDFLWKWIDGSDTDYKHWLERPSHLPKFAEFAKMEPSGFWNYVDLKEQLYFVCKKPAV